MDGFMKAMEFITNHGIHVVIMYIGIALILAGLLRAVLKDGWTMGESAASALAILLLVVCLVSLMPVSKGFSTIVAGIPIIGDVMDYGTVLSLLQNEPLGALVAFVDCFILMLFTDIVGKFSWGGNFVTKLLANLVTMVVCVIMLDVIKSLPVHDKIVTAIYALGGLSIVGMVIFMFCALFLGTALPGIMMVMPACVRRAVYKTMLIVLALFVISDVMGIGLEGIATAAVKILGSFAPVALVVFACIMLIIS